MFFLRYRKLLFKIKIQPIDLRRRYQRIFDNINHQWLLTNIPMEKSIPTKFLNAGFIYKRHLNPTKAGTPQGGVVRREVMP